ncbi:MAG: hypothetical protein ACI8ZO_000087 [Flavobacteriales bacterium]|jgi:hypothetical protein
MTTRTYPQEPNPYLKPLKSLKTGLILCLLFGPFGLLYASIKGALIMILTAILLGFFNLGIGLIITWIVCIIWARIAINDANEPKPFITWRLHK